MVGINIQCRLGNQLFQYAFIKALSEKFDTSFYLNEKIEPLIAADYFEFEGYSPFKNAINKFLLKIESGTLFKSMGARDVNEYNDILKASLTNKTVYNGYFQSEIYFKNITDKMPGYVRVKKEHVNRFEAAYGNTFAANSTIAIHIRRGDYLQMSNWWAENFGGYDLSLPLSYYANCLQQIENYRDYKIIFISYDIEFVRSAFSHLPNAEFSDNDMIIDFQIIKNSDISIISNSSFAWWAAYLNPNPEKKIFCPQYWLGFKIQKEYPENIIPLNWVQVKVD